MGKSGKPGYYAVARGRVPGIYSSWDECQAQTAGFAGNKHQKFSSLEQARQYLSQHGVAAAVPPPSAAAASAVASSSTTPNLQTASSKRARTHRTKPYARVQSPLSSAAGNTAKPRNAQWAALTKEIIEDESGWDVVYSDGACKGNGKVGAIAGIGVWWAENYPRNLAERCPGFQTNNRAELIEQNPKSLLTFNHYVCLYPELYRSAPGKAAIYELPAYLDVALKGLDVAALSVRHVGCTFAARATPILDIMSNALQQLVPVLDGSNYTRWADLMKAYLMNSEPRRL
ncbi:hypothetical protein ACG7TL_006709 [Trametes sanguinea]